MQKDDIPQNSSNPTDYPSELIRKDTEKIPRATHSGDLDIGGVIIPCAVLEDGRRVLTQQGVLRAIGRARSAKGSQGATAGGMPAFLAAKNLRPYVDEVFGAKDVATAPIIYKPLQGARAFGYLAEMLPLVCHVYLKARDAGDVLHDKQLPIAKTCDILIRGLATVGIAALVDEATGYQEVRDRKALQEILARYISGELLEWAKMFPDEFYKELFRLREWQYQNMSMKRPVLVGKLTVDLVYKRLAPGVYEKLKEVNPKDTKGRLKHKYHHWLTDEEGKPALDRHMFALTTLMRASPTWDAFMRLVNRSLPIQTQMLPLPGIEWNDYNDE